MKRRIIACAITMSLVFATGAMAHGDEVHKAQTEKMEKQAGGHAAAIGIPGEPDKVTRTIEVEMGDDMRFRPDTIHVKRGETIRFVVRNTGKLKHEMVLGEVEELKKHAELMRKFPEMEHDDPNQAGADPGKTAEMIWRFTQSGTFDFACLYPGHFESGMVGKILVEGGNGAESIDRGQAMTPGEVRKVDKAAGKVTIRHGPLENLGMPNMTMVFRVQDPAMLDRLKEGDNIRFIAEKVNGLFTVIRVESAE